MLYQTYCEGKHFLNNLTLVGFMGQIRIEVDKGFCEVCFILNFFKCLKGFTIKMNCDRMKKNREKNGVCMFGIYFNVN